MQSVVNRTHTPPQVDPAWLTRDREVLKSLSDLPPKVGGLIGLEEMQHDLSQATGIRCSVPPWLYVPVARLFCQELRPQLVSDFSIETLKNPRAAAPVGIKALEGRLGEAHAAFQPLLGPGGKAIIRSAGGHEDGKRLSFAGRYKSLLVPSQTLEDFVRVGMDVVMSPFEPPALRYHYFNEVPLSPIDVFVMKMVPNCVALNFTVSSEGIERVLVSGWPKSKELIFEPNSRAGNFVLPRSGLPWHDRAAHAVIRDLVQGVETEFAKMAAKKGGAISIEAAFDYSRLVENRVGELALLQERTLPKPKVAQSKVATQDAVGLAVLAELKAGPCDFDSIIYCDEVLEYASVDLGAELITLINRLRDLGKRHTLLVIPMQKSTEGVLQTAVMSLPFVGFIDEYLYHEYNVRKPRRVNFAGHIEHIISETHQLIANVPYFMKVLRPEFSEDISEVKIANPLIPDALTCLLAGDMVPAKYFEEDDDYTVRTPVERDGDAPRSGIKRVATSFTLRSPLRMEVVAQGDNVRHLSRTIEDSSGVENFLKISPTSNNDRNS